MCNALKDHVAKVEDNLLKGTSCRYRLFLSFNSAYGLPLNHFLLLLGETDRDELQFEGNKRFEQFQARMIFIVRKLP